MELDANANKILSAAYTCAKQNRHEYLTPEHILYSSLFFDEGLSIIENCGGNIEDLKTDLEKYFVDNIALIDNGEPVQTVGFNRVIQTAAMHCFSAGKQFVRIGDIIAAMYTETDSFAAYYLEKYGITRLVILEYISHGITALSDGSKGSADEKEAFQESTGNSTVQKEDFLSQFTVELVAKAAKNKIDPVIGRQNELRRTIHVLSRRSKNNPIHVGEPGVGKTAITEGLAAMIAKGEVPGKLKGSKIYSLDIGSLIAGTKYRGDFEERVKKVLGELMKKDKAIIYIDEIHTIVGAGAVSGGAMDASNILKPYLTNGNLKFIGSTTYDEYKKHFEKDGALSRRFQKIDIAEPTLDQTFEILKGLKEKYESFHNVTYTEEALRTACELSFKYINDRRLPDKAIDVIDEAGALARLEAGDMEPFVYVDRKSIEKVISGIARIPIMQVTQTEIDKLRTLDEEIKKGVFGQEKAVSAVVKAIRSSRAGFTDGEKPVASLLFVGPTGVGKTELAKQLANILGISLQRFDMSEYQERHAVARLIGSPPGYVGYEEGGLLTDTIRKNPHCVLLLDEIEKAHPDIFNVLLQVMDYATLTDNAGKKADFKNVILIMTSNAGAKDVGKTLIGFENREIDKSAILKEVDKVFLPEFRNRLDGVIVFNDIDIVMARKIVQKQLGLFEKKLREKHVSVEMTESCMEYLAKKGVNSKFGAREIQRAFNDEIKSIFVEEVLYGCLHNGGKAVIDIETDENDKVKIKPLFSAKAEALC
jgi:ATP-dependent Clp protease ATP-binding subunit ClpA